MISITYLNGAIDIKHGLNEECSCRGGRADNFPSLALLLAKEVHTRQARDLLSLPGTLGFKMVGQIDRHENPNPGAIILVISVESFISEQEGLKDHG